MKEPIGNPPPECLLGISKDLIIGPLRSEQGITQRGSLARLNHLDIEEVTSLSRLVLLDFEALGLKVHIRRGLRVQS